MGIISIEHGSSLFWLGRYVERTFTMQKAALHVYDRFIDGDTAVRKQYLDKLYITDEWGDENANQCFKTLLFDINNPHSVRYSLERAYDNGIVLREEISTEALSQIQLAMDAVDHAAVSKKSAAYSLLALEDRLFAFWGCINDYVFDSEILNLIMCGKLVERLDMYLRLDYPIEDIKLEFGRLCDILRNVPRDTPYRYNTKQISVLVEHMETEEDCRAHKGAMLASLGKIFEPNT